VVSAEYPQVIVLDLFCAFLRELELVYLFRCESVDGRVNAFGVFHPFGVEDDVHRVFVEVILGVGDESVGQLCDPPLVDRPVVEFSPDGAFGRFYDVHLHVTERGDLPLPEQILQFDPKVLTVVDAFQDRRTYVGRRFPRRFRRPLLLRAYESDAHMSRRKVSDARGEAMRTHWGGLRFLRTFLRALFFLYLFSFSFSFPLSFFLNLRRHTEQCKAGE
jgi:hypothetical protein